MNLKKIEAYGFKSFADKLTLNFNSGVTCIVGPNGCGKSNVSDAIRWVLGEQSPKNLRGKSMQEVIFNGTANRKAMGYCEVSLYFDNTARTYALDADEVIIKRKLFRSGDSEYYINNDPCRLRDILDLFRDTGIGKDGYSVVGQGKIDSFLSARPEDRRQIFEEAAGISKFRAKRTESQRKLDRTADSLLRIRDKLDVYEERMRPLQKQADEALKARELKDRLRADDINHLIYLSEHNAEELGAVTEKLAKITKNLDSAEKESILLEQRYHDATEELTGIDGTYKSLTEQKLDLTVALSKKAGQNDLKVQKLEQVRAEANRLEGERAEKSAAVQTYASANEQYKKEQVETMAELVKEKANEEEVTARCAELETALNAKRKEIEVTNDLLWRSADDWGKISGGVSKLTTEISLLEESVGKNETEISVRKEELKKIDKSLTDLNKAIEEKTLDRDEKRTIKKRGQELYAEKMNAFDDSQDKYAEMRDTVAKLTSKVEYLEANKNSYNAYGAAVRTLMSADEYVKGKILGVVGSVLTTPTQFATAIEVALGGNINNMITADQTDTSFLIDYLNKQRGGRGTFMPLTMMRPKAIEDQYLDALDEEGVYGVAADLVKYDRRFRPAIETLLGRVVVVDTKDTAVDMAKRYKSAFRIVTLDGAHYAVDGTVSGGRREGTDSHMLGMEAALAEAKRTLSSDKKIMDVLRADVEEYRTALKKIEDEEKILDGIIAKLEKELGVFEEKRINAESEKVRLESEIKDLTQSVSDAKLNIAAKKTLLQAESDKFDSTSGAKEDASGLLNKLAEEVAAIQKEYDKANSEKVATVVTIRRLEGTVDDYVKTVAVNEKTIDRLNGEIDASGVRLKLLAAEEKDIVEELERLSKELADNDEIVRLQEQIDSLDNRKIELNKEQEEIRRAELRNGEEVSTLTAAKARAEAALERIEDEMRQAGERVKEDYGLDYEGALIYKREGYDDEKGVAEAKILRKELAKMGDINEKAVDDLAELNSEYSALKIHFDDITEAKASLEETIRDLTATMEKQFSESFEQIKVNFAEVFRELFDGGRGMLDLDIERGMSVLDAGIVIAAEPPGKRLTNIDLLSGGERAMTAIAIIFAIIKLHPMPFCVLDEVDAPLDDANADTYAKYLKKFSKDTQFIIVSHRKPTMELADDLYGITMQEKGVSKFFTVKLSDALKMAK
ncbi:MAG: chromosome segregation protein SMC [Clostridia bacterium]|nr:chromosome segregation protein SMC [Clostridia bacterium]